MTTVYLATTPKQRFVDANGNALVGGLLYSYAAGTSTPQATYTDSTATTANANPVVLDARGECNLWLDSTLSYKFVLKDSAGNLIWSQDNAPGASLPATVAAASQPYINARTGTDGTLGFRNRLRNGNFAINQRGVSGTVTLAAGAYGHDGWKAGASGCTYTFATSGNVTVLTISAGSLLQVVEGSNVEGGTFALSNQGTAPARIAVNGASTSGTYVSATSATPLVSANATGGQQVTVEFSTGTLDRVQLEPGTVATTFERRPASVDLAICQRYYEIVHVSMAGVAAAGGHQWGSGYNFKVSKRAAPTMASLTTSVSVNVSGSTLDSIDVQGFRYYVTANAAGVFAADGTASASAEL